MERPVSALQQRTTSFNPEAAAFNPVFCALTTQDADTVPVTSPVPSQGQDTAFPMASMFNCESS